MVFSVSLTDNQLPQTVRSVYNVGFPPCCVPGWGGCILQVCSRRLVLSGLLSQPPEPHGALGCYPCLSPVAAVVCPVRSQRRPTQQACGLSSQRKNFMIGARLNPTH
ncbi:hypothetical protein DPEC_G00332240 [Dallia pectoralis]|uniref:Uncharacterized protein n=1 Tax=Dallia pectoralis TaxID=75939 RepID=A0ACC2F696_DALPE|nr:hypothetical protein DPEC_G00332240 [Dallia pectoralis]